MRLKNLNVIAGMAMQAAASGSFAFLGFFTICPDQQFTTAGIYLIFMFGWVLLQETLPKVLIGMYLQATIAAIAAYLGLISLSAFNQLIFVGLYCAIILLILQLRKIRAAREEYFSHFPA